MSEDLTRQLPKRDSERLELILTTTQTLGGRFDHLEARFQDLEKKVEEKLYDTRPIWHKVISDIAHLQSGQDSLATNIAELRTNVAGLQTNVAGWQTGQQDLRSLMFELSSTVRQVNRDQIVMNDVIRRIQLDFHNFDERLHAFLLKHDKQN